MKKRNITFYYITEIAKLNPITLYVMGHVMTCNKYDSDIPAVQPESPFPIFYYVH